MPTSCRSCRFTRTVMPMTVRSVPGFREMRLATGLTITELAGRVGCDPSYLGRIESGERSGSRYFIAHLAAVIDAVLEEQAAA